MNIRRRPSAPLIISLIALCMSIGGTSWAAVQITGKQIKDNTVESRDIKNGTTATKDIKSSAITSALIATSAITGSDIKDGEVASADITDGSVAESDLTSAAQTKLNDTDTSPWETIPSGTTVTGGFYESYPVSATSAPYAVNMQLPAMPPSAPTSVNFAADSEAVTDDDDPSCTGTHTAPTAPAGKICVYLTPGSATNVDNLSADKWVVAAHQAMGLWYIVWTDDAAAPNTGEFWGTWAYTAP